MASEQELAGVLFGLKRLSVQLPPNVNEHLVNSLKAVMPDGKMVDGVFRVYKDYDPFNCIKRQRQLMILPDFCAEPVTVDRRGEEARDIVQPCPPVICPIN